MQGEVNLFGVAALTRACFPKREQGSVKIINARSMNGKIYALLGAWHHATKSMRSS